MGGLGNRHQRKSVSRVILIIPFLTICSSFVDRLLATAPSQDALIRNRRRLSDNNVQSPSTPLNCFLRELLVDSCSAAGNLEILQDNARSSQRGRVCSCAISSLYHSCQQHSGIDQGRFGRRTQSSHSLTRAESRWESSTGNTDAAQRTLVTPKRFQV